MKNKVFYYNFFSFNHPSFYTNLLLLFGFAWKLSLGQVTYYTRGAGGNWSNPLTWSTAGCNGPAASSIPGATDNVVICNSNGGGAVTVVVDGNFS